MATQQVLYSPAAQPVVFAAAAAGWVTSTSYTVGIVVTNSGSSYFCLVAHTSGTFATDLAAGKWLLVTAYTWTPQNISAANGRISNVWDRGAGDLPVEYVWRCSTRWAATVSANDALRLYAITSYASATAALCDGNLTLGDATLTSETNSSINGRYFGQVLAATATDQLWVKSGVVSLRSRYVGVVGWNSSATKALTNTASDHWLILTAIPPAIQAAA